MKNNNSDTIEVASIQVTYQQLVENMHEGLIILDTEGVITYVNDQYCQMLGYSRKELIGNQVSVILDRANQMLLKEQVAKRAQGESEPYEMSVTHKAGHQVPIIVSPQPLVDDQGQMQGSFAIISNLSTHKQAEAMFAKRAVELEAVTEVAAAASTNLDTTELLHAVVNLTKERFGLYHAHIYLLDEAAKTLTLVAGAGAIGQQMVQQQWHIPLSNRQSIVGRTALIRQSVMVNNVQESEYWLPNLLLPETRSELAVPLVVGNRLLGVLDVQANTLNAFTEEDIRVHTALAAQVAVALQNATLYAEARQRAIEMETLSKISQRLSAVLELDQLVAEVVEQVTKAFGYYYVQIYLYDQWQENLILTGGSGAIGKQLLAQQHSLPYGRGLVGRAAAQNRIIFVPDVERRVDVELITPANVAEIYQREVDPAVETVWYNSLIERTFGAKQALAAEIKRTGRTLKIGYVAHIPGVFPTMLQRGVEAAAKDLSIETIFVMPERAGEHLPLFEAFVQQQVDGLVVVPDHPHWIEAIAQAQHAGIPVVTANRDLENSPAMMHVGLDNFQAGNLLANALIGLLESANIQSGTILISTGVEGRTAGIKYALADTNYTLIKLEKYVEDEDLLKTIWSEAIKQHSDIVATLSTTSTESPILAEIKRRTQGDWFILGFDLDLATLAAVKEGLIQGTLDQHSYLQGYLPVMALAEHLCLGRELSGWMAERWLPNPLLPETKAEIAVPIAMGDGVQGVLDIQHNVSGELTTDNINLLRSVADQVAVGLRNASLFDTAQQSSTLLDKRIRELNCLNDISREMLDNPPAAQLLSWVAKRIPLAMQYPELCRVAITFENQTYGQAEAVSLSRQMTHGVRVAGNVIGHIYVAYTQRHDFLNEESGLLGGVANRLSSYMESRQLYQQAQQRATGLETLSQVSRRLSAVLDPKQLIAEVVDQIASAFQYYYSQIYLFDNDHENLLLAGGSGEVGRQLLARQHYLPKTRGLVGRAAAQNSVVLAPDVRRHIGVELIGRDNLQEVYQRETDPAFELEWYAQHIAQQFGVIEANSADEELLRLGYVYQDNSDFLKMIKRGVDAAARDLHVEVEVVTAQVSGQHAPLFEEMVKQKKDGLVTVPDHPDWVWRINAALDAGIPVVTSNRELQGSSALAHAGQDNFQSGTVLARELIELLRAAGYQEGKILVGSIVPDRQAGLEHGLRATPYQLIKLDRFVSRMEQTNLSPEASFQEALRQLEAYWEEAVTNYPDLIAAVGLAEPETYLLASIKQRHAGQWLIAGYDLHPRTLEAIQEGLVQLAIGQHPFLQGYLPVLALVEHLRHGKSLEGWITDGWLPNSLLPETQTEVAIPITMGNQILGVLDVQHNVANSFDREDVNLLRSVADQVGVALQTANLYQQAQQRAKREQMLREVTTRIRSSTDVDTVMRTAAQEVGRVLGRQTFVYLGGQTNGPANRSVDISGKPVEELNEEMSGAAGSTPEPVISNQIEREGQHEQ